MYHLEGTASPAVVVLIVQFITDRLLVFCITYIGSEVLSSSPLTEVRRTANSLYFHSISRSKRQTVDGVRFCRNCRYLTVDIDIPRSCVGSPVNHSRITTIVGNSQAGRFETRRLFARNIADCHLRQEVLTCDLLIILIIIVIVPACYSCIRCRNTLPVARRRNICRCNTLDTDQQVATGVVVRFIERYYHLVAFHCERSGIHDFRQRSPIHERIGSEGGCRRSLHICLKRSISEGEGCRRREEGQLLDLTPLYSRQRICRNNELTP